MINHQPVNSPNSPVIILIVDGQADDRLRLQAAFERLRPAIQLTSLADGREAIAYLDQCLILPRLMVTDLTMTITGGLDLIRYVRQHWRLNSVPIVVWTHSREPDDRLRCLLAGADGFAIKPSLLPDLLRWVGQLTEEWL